MRWTRAAVIVLSLLVPGAAAAAPPTTGAGALPATPAAARGIVYARAFALDTGFPYEWSAPGIDVREGLMLVLEAEPALLRARETQEPILYVGTYPAAIVSRSVARGRVVVFVPARVDLDTEPAWFGTPGLAEQVTDEIAAAERARALAAGVRPFAAAQVAAARARGGDDARFATRVDLLRALEQLAIEYAR